MLRLDNSGPIRPAGGPCPGYYYAGDFPDVDRDAFGKRHHIAVGNRVHIDRAYDIPVTLKATGITSPVPPFGLVTMAAYGTPAGRTSLVPGEAHDAVFFRLLFQIVDVLPVLPLAHALVVVTATISAAGSVRVANENRLHPMRRTKIHYLPRSFMPQITDPTLASEGESGTSFPELFPAARAFLATRRASHYEPLPIKGRAQPGG